MEILEPSALRKAPTNKRLLVLYKLLAVFLNLDEGDVILT